MRDSIGFVAGGAQDDLDIAARRLCGEQAQLGPGAPTKASTSGFFERIFSMSRAIFSVCSSGVPEAAR